ncbi:MAG: hypothetical protein QM496_08835 [Verrucomicrobiota bacterium]
MKTKTTLASLAIALLFTGVSHAGPPVQYNNAPASSAELFSPGFSASAFAAYLKPDGNLAEDTWGGGIGGEYFFTSMLGLAASGTWVDPGTDEIWHNYVTDVVFRIPFESLHIAPYALAGIGVIIEDDTSILGRAGAGIDMRFTPAFGIFSDWIYTFPSGGGRKANTEDYQFIRIGAKINF